jgi:cytochrome bd ubiquinol oxidase subunit II
MVLWLLLLRGISIEFRSKEDNRLWRTFWDSTLCLSSLMLTMVFGAALGNIIRGVPLDASGYFDGALFTNFRIGRNPGVLDWYTVSVGVFACVVVAGHGALYLVWRTVGPVHDRARNVAKSIWILIVSLTFVITYLTNVVRPGLFKTLMDRPLAYSLAILIVISLVSLGRSFAKNRALLGFVSSSCFIVGILAATAAGMYPNMLISTIDSTFSITAGNGAASHSILNSALIWFLPAALLMIGYFTVLYVLLGGKVEIIHDQSQQN